MGRRLFFHDALLSKERKKASQGNCPYNPWRLFVFLFVKFFVWKTEG
jgi:hypothetical protein